MSNLDSNLNRDDLETLLEATNDWELIGSNDLYSLNILKAIPLPAEDHESYKFIRDLKDYYRSREKDIRAARAVRQEKAIFLKAKLMMLKRDLDINKLFDEAQSPIVEVAKFVPESTEPKVEDSVMLSLSRAEDFIRDLGVWEHYQKFCLERFLK